MLRTLTMLMAASVAAISFAEKLVVKSVDNKTGVATIQTGSKNQLVAVIQRDKKGSIVRSWTVRTNDKGSALVENEGGLDKDSIELRALRLPEIVAPNNIAAGEVFSFSLPNAPEGESVDIKTVEGEVVATKRTDYLGRIFVPLGLAAGAYVITRVGSPKSSPLQVLANGGEQPANPQWSDCSAAMHLVGTSACENVVFSGSPNVTVPVLAASQGDVVCAPPADYGVTGGNQAVFMTDAQRQLVNATQVSMYNLQGVINRSKLMTGEAARLEFTLSPPDLKGEIIVGVLGGPVMLSNGGQATTVPIENGKAVTVVQTIAGQSGPFQLGWMFRPDNRGHGAQEEGPFKDGDGNTVTPQEKGPGYRRDHVKPPSGASWISEWFDVPGTRWWKPFRFQKISKTDGKVETEEFISWKDGKKVGGHRTIKTKKPDGSYSEKKETYNPDTDTWSEDKV